MPAAHRNTDICTGHGCYPPRQNLDGSKNVFVNSLGWHLKGGSWASHCCGDECHATKTAEGSSTVFVNSIPVARIGDPLHCGSACGKGSPNVFAGG